MAKQPLKIPLVPPATGKTLVVPSHGNKPPTVIVGFNYDSLETKLADKLRSAADRIRAKVKKTLQDIIEIGNDLLTVKEALEHGEFLPWLKAEFGWGDRMAQNFMSVAQRFGPKSEIIADLTIQPTAAYLLAGPLVPDEAREKAVKRAEAGEQITTVVAKEILADTRKKKRPRRHKALSIDKLGARLLTVLERYRERWDPAGHAELARQLRDFADTLTERKSGKKEKKE